MHVVFVSVVEPLAVVIHIEIHLQPETENYAHPRVELELISNDVSVALRTCQVFCVFCLHVDLLPSVLSHCWFNITKGTFF